ncbi:MAG TPA: Flp family type IVb pilin [Gaiellaceae bacterium]|nr:Flp family type IVb pilin [Gaiellaceae bacterium]
MLASLRCRGIAALGALRSATRREDGQALVEYALILSLVSIAAYVVLRTMGTSLNGLIQGVANDL